MSSAEEPTSFARGARGDGATVHLRRVDTIARGARGDAVFISNSWDKFHLTHAFGVSQNRQIQKTRNVEKTENAKKCEMSKK